MIEEKEELMVPHTSGVLPTFRKAHFLKPILNPENQPPPRPHADVSLFSNPCMKMNEVITKRVLFRGRIRQLKGWKDWVEELQKAHQEIWKKVGIFDAIRASIYNIRRHDELVIWLAQKWCPETNTLVFPWGETTMTLEDVLILGGFSVLGISVKCPVENPENKLLERKLVDGCAEIKKNTINFFVTHSQWMKYFKGCGDELENVALIALWLSRYVFSTSCYAVICPLVFPIAVTLARGTRVALAPAVLAAIYRDMTLLKQKIMTLRTNGGDDGLNIILWSPLQLLQAWAWERFSTFSPKPTSLVPGEPRLVRWHNVKKPKNELPGSDMEFLGDDFVWRPYSLNLENWVFPKFYPDKETWVLVHAEIDEELLSWTQCLRASELVGMNGMEKYLPHRVAMQFGLDQHMPGFLSQVNDNVELAWSWYTKLPDGLRLYLPPRLFEGDVTVQYCDWWRDAPSLNNEPWLVCKRRRRSDRELKQLRHKKLYEVLTSLEIISSQYARNLVNEDPRECDQIVIEERKGKKLMESHANMAECNNRFGGSKKPLSLDINLSQLSQTVINEDAEKCGEIGMERQKENELKGNNMDTADCSKHLEESKNPSSKINRSQFFQSLVNEDAQQCKEAVMVRQKEKELIERDMIMAGFSNNSEGCKSQSSFDTSPSQFSQNLVDEGTQQSKKIVIIKGKELKNNNKSLTGCSRGLVGSKNTPCLEIIPCKSSQNLVINDAQQCEMISVEEQNGKKLSSADYSRHSEESQSKSAEGQGKNGSTKEPPSLRELEMKKLGCAGMDEDEQNKDRDEAGPNLEKKEPDNVVIIDEVDEDGSNHDPYELLGGYELEARIRRLQIVFTALEAARQKFIHSK